jgi:hypothetical protein
VVEISETFRSPNSPPLRCQCSFQLISEPVWLIWNVLVSLLIESMLFKGRDGYP